MKRTENPWARPKMDNNSRSEVTPERGRGLKHRKNNSVFSSLLSDNGQAGLDTGPTVSIEDTEIAAVPIVHPLKTTKQPPARISARELAKRGMRIEYGHGPAFGPGNYRIVKK